MSAKRRVFSDAEVRAILSDPRPYREIAAAHSTWAHVVSDIKCRRTYRHVRLDGAKVCRRQRYRRVLFDGKTPRKPRAPRRVFSEAEVRSILADARPYGEIAAAHGTWKHVIAGMKWRRTYRHVLFDGVIIRRPPRKKSRLTI